MNSELEELNEWRKTFPGLTAQEVSLRLARAQFANKANVRDLLPAAEDCYKALRELPSYCLSAWEGQKMANRIRNYIDALEKEVGKRPNDHCGAMFQLANGELVSLCHKPKGHVGSHEGYCLGSPCVWPQGFSSEDEISEDTVSNPPMSDALGWVD